MTLKKLALKTPQHWDNITIFNQGLSKEVVEYRFVVGLEILKQATDLDPLPTVADILRFVGSHATLWIGSHKGLVAPMDQQPKGWTYPSGREYEAENFWQWVPDAESEAKLVSDSNRFSDNPVEVITAENKSVFKALVPVQLDRQYGQMQAIDAIPVQRLAGLVSKGVDWMFEFEQRA